MVYHVASVLLGPFFYLQGKYVKRVTPKLPEPGGPRSGQSGSGSPLSLLIVGDSAAAGVGVEHQQQALSGSVVAALSAHYQVSWKLLAETGDTSAQLLAKIEAASQGEQFDFVLVSIGVNDVTGLTSSQRWLSNLDAISVALRHKFGARQILFSSLPPMHLFSALPQPLRWWLGTRAKQLNLLMAQFSANSSHCSFLNIPYSTNTQLVAADGFHPGALAYKLWGEFVAEVIHAE